MMNQISEFEKKFIERLDKLKGLYNEVNNVIILHEYITGEFYLPPIVNFRTFSDLMFFCFKKKDTQKLDIDFQNMEATLNEAGHGTLDSLLSKIIDEIDLITDRFEHEVLERITDNYSEVKLLIKKAKKYVELFINDKKKILNKSFIDSFNEFKEIPKFYDQLINKGHLLNSYQKERDTDKRFSLLNSNIHNLIIGAVSTILTFILINSFAEDILNHLINKNPVDTSPVELNFPIDTNSADTSDFVLLFDSKKDINTLKSRDTVLRLR